MADALQGTKAPTIFDEIAAYQVKYHYPADGVDSERTRTHDSMRIPLRDLVSSFDPGGDMKIRRVFHNRLLQMVKKLVSTGLYLSNFPLLVREGADGKYYIFDGNHRYHAVHYIIANYVGTGWSLDSEIPCIAYRADLPDHTAMRYGVVMNEFQTCGENAHVLDLLRFLKNEQVVARGVMTEKAHVEALLVHFACINEHPVLRCVCIYLCIYLCVYVCVSMRVCLCVSISVCVQQACVVCLGRIGAEQVAREQPLGGGRSVLPQNHRS
jgi:hypothetical protein